MVAVEEDGGGGVAVWSMVMGEAEAGEVAVGGVAVAGGGVTFVVNTVLYTTPRERRKCSSISSGFTETVVVDEFSSVGLGFVFIGRS